MTRIPCGAVSVLVVHGGAGDLRREGLGSEPLRAARSQLVAALRAGERVLGRGGRALDAVVEAVSALEESACFNAGRGSVLRSDGRVAMDASVMEGSGERGGAVACVHRVRNPVRAAREVLEAGAHVLLIGEGAERFAAERGLALEPERYFVTERRAAELQRQRAGAPAAPARETVGAVALDDRGGLAAATSTGGTTGGDPARVGDSPILGAGTWARDATCAVSATGQGEIFVRTAFAHEVDAALRMAGVTLEQACELALARVRALGGRGGCIAVDAGGNVAMPFSTPAMPRGLIRSGDRAPALALYSGESLTTGED